MDYCLPGIEGLEATRKPREIRPDIPVVVSAIHEAAPCRDEAVFAGAITDILGPRPEAELSPVIEGLPEAGGVVDGR